MNAGGPEIGDLAAMLELPDTEGVVHTLPDPGEAPATVVVWTCNHCPYALAWHDRLLDVARDHAGAGVGMLMVNSNDAGRYPADSFEAMRDRHRAESWPVPYLHDATQSVARSWGARTTPDVFLLDSGLRLAYRGAPDPDHERPELAAGWLRDALSAVLAGEQPEPSRTQPIGCSIKWRE